MITVYTEVEIFCCQTRGATIVQTHTIVAIWLVVNNTSIAGFAVAMILPSINKLLLAPKLAYFFFFFSYSSVSPFIAVFMSTNGLNPQQSGFIIGSRCFAQFLSGPVWGAIADKTNRNKVILMIQIIVSTVALFSTPWIPLALPNDARSPCQYRSNSNHNATQTIFTNGTRVLMANFAKNFKASNGSQKLPFSTKVPIKYLSNLTRKPSALTTKSPYTQSDEAKGEPRTCKYSTNLLFILMLVLFVVVGTFEGGILLLVDNHVIQLVREVPGCEFGKQRLWGGVGFGLASFASGLGIDLSGSKGPNYFTMFYIYLASNTILLVPCFLMDMASHRDEVSQSKTIREEPKKRNFMAIVKEVFVAFRRFNVPFFFTTVFIMGMADNLLNSYFFLYIRDLRGTEIIMGLSIVVACTSEVLIFPFTDKIIKFFRGTLITIAVGVMTYSLRFLAFSLVQNPWHLLPFQLLHSVSFAMFWAAAVYHTNDIAPKGIKATFLGILNGMFFGISGGIASIVGGIVYNITGGRIVFRGYAITLAVWAFLLILHIMERKFHDKLRKFQVKLNKEDEVKELDEISPCESLVKET